MAGRLRAFALLGVDEWSGPAADRAERDRARRPRLCARARASPTARSAVYAVLVAATSPLLAVQRAHDAGRGALVRAADRDRAVRGMRALRRAGRQREPAARRRRLAGWPRRRAASRSPCARAGRCSARCRRSARPSCSRPSSPASCAARRSDPIGLRARAARCGALAALATAAGRARGVRRPAPATARGSAACRRAANRRRSRSMIEPLVPRVRAVERAAAARARAAGVLRPERRKQRAPAAAARFPLVALLWLAFSYAALTLFLSRYGDKAAVFPVGALAAAVALLLRDLERSRERRLAGGDRGRAARRAAPTRLRALSELAACTACRWRISTVPEVFNPRAHLVRWCSALFGAARRARLRRLRGADAPQRRCASS